MWVNELQIQPTTAIIVRLIRGVRKFYSKRLKNPIRALHPACFSSENTYHNRQHPYIFAGAHHQLKNKNKTTEIRMHTHYDKNVQNYSVETYSGE